MISPYLFRPGSLDKLRVDDLGPTLLALHVGAVGEMLRNQLPPLPVFLHQLLETHVLYHTPTYDVVERKLCTTSNGTMYIK